ncbi:hypothetical protein [Pseudonocardia sp. ICBG601]|uniref:hypothetical protein n=1 Tax=Pseudonocardia sp. ICBG601 TaxID=2846759 RepID=UPI001CF6BB0A|nr:hypothetical protein [Pseudonocardia sp. ICBG601]
MGFWTDPGGALAESAAEILAALLTWWLTEETVFSGLEGHAARFAVLTGPIVAAIVTICLLCQVGKMILTCRGEPLVDAAAGLIRFVAATTVGVLLTVTVLAAADAATTEFLGAALPEFVDRLTTVLQLSQMGVGSQILLGTVVLVLGALQWLAMFVRQAGIFVLIAVLPIAAAGALSGATRRWLPTVIAWLAALIFYKPAAGLIYAIGMTLMSTPTPATGGPEWVAILVGIVILALAVIALPALLRFFSFTGTTITTGSAGGMVAGAATGAVSLAGMRNSRSMELTGPDSAPAWTTPPATSPTGSPGAGDPHPGVGGAGTGPGAGSGPGTPDPPGAGSGATAGPQNTPAPAPGPAPGAATGTSTAGAAGGAGAAVSGVGAAAAAGAAAVQAAQSAQSAAEATADQLTGPTRDNPDPGADSHGSAGGPSGAGAAPPGAGTDTDGAGR